MISFYPGPSRVHDEIPLYVQDAFEAGLLSINHRSDEFMAMSERTIALLKDRLDIPPDYTVFYTTSATECWEIIAQSLVVRESYHFFSGAFGKKWFEYTRRLRPGAQPYPFDRMKPAAAASTIRRIGAILAREAPRSIWKPCCSGS